MLKIEYLPIGELKPYENNPRKNDEAVRYVANSIKEFGFKVPIIITKDREIVAGHTRLKAAKCLKMKEVPCIIADDLTEEQIKAFRLADNKVAEFAEWDWATLDSELAEVAQIDMSMFGFSADAIQDHAADWFKERERFDDARQDGNEEYNEFLDKFEIKKTTDDCYTPDNIYDLIAQYVEDEYGENRNDFVRPFYPGGDYESENYSGKVVVDNPPFSILSKIVDFYVDNGIKFFLFAPGVSTIGYSTRENVTCVCAFADITYENGASVKTNFLTNMGSDGVVAMSCPKLHDDIEELNAKNERELHRELPKYSYPVHVATAAMLGYLSEHGEELKIQRSDAVLIRALDAQKESGKAIFGGGLLLSEKAAAEKAAAEKAAAEKFELSEREWEIVRSLGGNNEQERMEG